MSRINVTIKMPEMDQFLLKAHGTERALVPDETSALTIMGNDMLAVVKQNWPVATGTSRGAWSFYVNPSPGQLAFVFVNSVWYSSWITRKGERTVADGGEPLFRRLLPSVWRAAKPKTFRLLREAIERTEKQFAAAVPVIPTKQRAKRLSFIELLQRGAL